MFIIMLLWSQLCSLLSVTKLFLHSFQHFFTQKKRQQTHLWNYLRKVAENTSSIQQEKQHNIVKFLFDIRNIIFYDSFFPSLPNNNSEVNNFFLWLWCEYKFLHIQTHLPNIWQQKIIILHCLHHKLACRTLWRTRNFISCFLLNSIHESRNFMLTYSDTFFFFKKPRKNENAKLDFFMNQKTSEKVYK